MSGVKKTISSVLIAVFAAVALFVSFGFTLTADATLAHSGKGSVTVSVISESAEDEFRDTIDEYIDGVNSVSGDSDMVRVTKIIKKETGYSLTIAFRRIDKIGGIGVFDFADFSAYVTTESMTRRLVENWSNGNLRGTVSVVFDHGMSGIVEMSRNHNPDKLLTPRTPTGESVNIDDFLADGERSESDKIVAFRIFNTENVESITLSVPGNIRYVTGDAEVASDRTVTIKPALYKADITRYQEETLENGETTFRPVYLPDETVSAMFGYIVFEKTLSPLALGFIIAASAIVLLLIIFVFVKFYRVGKKSAKAAPTALGSPFDSPQPAFGSAASSSAATAAHAETAATALVEKTPSPELSSPELPSPESPAPTNAYAADSAHGLGFGAAIAAGARRVFSSQTFKNIARHKTLYLMLLPAIALIAVFCYGSMFGLVVAFQDYKLLEGVSGSEWVGLKHFRSILFATSNGTYRVFRNTIYISLVRIATNFPLVLLFTLLINEIQSRKVKGVVQTVSYIPYFISWIAVSGMAYNLLSVDGGVINKVLAAFGRDPVVWYSEDNSVWWIILAVSSLWKGMGWATLIYISGLGTINEELYDACTIDGGGRLQKAISVTLPGLMSVIMLQLILDVASIMRDNYEQVLAMINNSQSLSHYTSVIGALSFDAIGRGDGLAKATAYGFIQGVIGVFLVMIANWLTKKTDNEGIL